MKNETRWDDQMDVADIVWKVAEFLPIYDRFVALLVCKLWSQVIKVPRIYYHMRWWNYGPIIFELGRADSVCGRNTYTEGGFILRYTFPTMTTAEMNMINIFAPTVPFLKSYESKKHLRKLAVPTLTTETCWVFTGGRYVWKKEITDPTNVYGSGVVSYKQHLYKILVTDVEFLARNCFGRVYIHAGVDPSGLTL